MSKEPRPRTAREYVRDHLRTEILSGELPGGTRLVQSTLAARLSVSTTPVREALNDLASDGFVRIDPHRGAVVNQASSSELKETFELRRILEPLAVRLAVPNVEPGDLTVLEDLVLQMDDHSSPRDWIQHNSAFHAVYLQRSGWPKLASIVSGLVDNAATYLATALQFRPEMMVQGNADHRTLVEATRSRDVELAVECIESHMDITMRAFEEGLS